MRQPMIPLPDSRPPIGPIPLRQVVEEKNATVEELAAFDLVATASAFGSLLLVPELQANCFRIQVLIHLAASHCAGTSEPSREFLSAAFERMNEGFCGMFEDPSEDLFVSTVHTESGNY